MVIVWLGLGTAVLGGVVGRLVHLIRTDGYGVRPPPRSHADWWEGAEPTGR